MIDLTELCQELRNWFEVGMSFDTYTIENGAIELPLMEGQYYRIVGSVFNDGVHVYPDADLQDEVFTGAVWAMAVPPAVSTLLSEINDWVSANSKVLDSPFSSESFGGYSYSKGSGSSSSGGGDYGWKDHFASRLNRWRKI